MDLRVTEPFPDYALPRVWHWIQGFRARVSDDFSPATLDAFVEYWEARKGHWRTFAVLRDDEIGGMVTVERLSPVVMSSHCTFKRSFWGHETTLESLRQIYAEVFRSTPEAHKILSFAFRDNAQLLGLARKLGAEKEGVLRKQTQRNGELVDMIAIGLLREDFEKVCLASEAH